MNYCISNPEISRMNKAGFRLLQFLLIMAIGLLATAESKAQMVSSLDQLDVQTALNVTQVEQGEEFRAVVELNIQYPWHVNSHTPTLEWLIPTTLEMERSEHIILTDIRYPPALTMTFGFAEEPLDVYEETSPIYLNLRTSSSTPIGEYILRAKLTVQACDDMQCLAPGTKTVEIPIQIVEAGAGMPSANEAQFLAYDDAVTGGSGSGDISALFDGNLFLAFLGIFLIGLALNLTPCVYPMISVTVSLFGGQQDTNTLRVFGKAVIYVLGIATMYSVLGVIAALSGGLFGSWLQSPWMLGFIGFLMFGLALSMFGLYEIQMPYWLTSKLGGSGSTGVIGLFISGLVVGIFAAPCVGPPIIALLAYVGTVGDPVFGFWVFFILSLGLGLPYLILGTFSGLMSQLPKSGTWMVWVKKLFGIILIGVGGFYLGLALFPQLVEWVIVGTLLIGGIYLGFIEQSGKGKTGFMITKYATGIVAIGLSVMLYMNLQKEGIIWETYSADKIEMAAQNGKPVMIDFYADWCIPCLELERITFTDQEVIDATQNMVRLKVDLTNFDSPESEALRQQYNIAGVPTIVFIDANGNEVQQARVIGFLRPNDFLQRVDMAHPRELTAAE
ncbi:MAG: thioredoxin family protein [Balneolales bacterium]|nr:thioredoxin family protein [Balneolales bacterium]